MCEIQAVCFEELALCFYTQASSDSSLRRIQLVMVYYVLDANLIARLVFSLLLQKAYKKTMADRNSI